VGIRARDVYTGAVAILRTVLTRVGASALRAHLAEGAALVAAAAVFRVIGDVGALAAARGEPSVATCDAYAKLAGGDAVGWLRAAEPAATAVRGVAFHVDARAVAILEPVVASVVAPTVRACRRRVQRRGALCAAGAAIFRVVHEDRALSRTDGFAFLARDSAGLTTCARGAEANVAFDVADVPTRAAPLLVARQTGEILRKIAGARGERARKREHERRPKAAKALRFHRSVTSRRPTHALGAHETATRR